MPVFDTTAIHTAAAVTYSLSGKTVRTLVFCAPARTGRYAGEHATIRKANKIPLKAKFDHLEIEDWCQSGFYVHYDNGQTAEVSWAFIRELPPKK